ncbi:MAG: sarcosine oxidase subunit alpha family protein [Acidisphaera sp.]|nr:sarcosine oxidase subunit alpha family protein [Acidisphaera sp.]
MTGAFRLAQGGRLDRSRPLGFSFDGKAMRGFSGDTLASALLANGVHLVGRSFKYHRPRGVLAAGAEEPNALVTIGRDGRRTPNLRATQIELHEGLAAESQNRFPSLRHDVYAAGRLAAPMLPAGFYYKTFKWPPGAWTRFYEPAIRAMAGLGRAPPSPDPDRYAQRYAHCDVLVVGAGPAGLAAALAAADAGARVMLCDEQAEPGGSLLAAEDATIDGIAAQAWLAEALRRLARAGATVLPRTTAFGYFAQNFLGLAERVTDHLASPDPSLPREKLWQVRAKEVVLATGAIEQPLVFSGNDRPGVMLADAARLYATRYAVRPGTRAVLATAHDSAYAAALALHRRGVHIAAIADLRARADGELPAAARAAGLAVRTGATIAGSLGGLRVGAALLGRNGARPERVSCDLLLMCGGWTPSVHLFSQSRGRLRFDAALDAYVPDASAQRERSAGACRGVFGLAAALADGAAAGGAAAGASGAPRRYAVRAPAAGTGEAPGLTGGGRGKAFVDFQNDVTAQDIALAAREGFRSIEHVKRYTTAGMATDQGKTANMNALSLLAAAVAAPVPTVGHTTFRMPYTPVTFGTFAGLARGDLFEPVRTTPMHGWAAAEGARFEDVGTWKRAHYFPRNCETMHAAVARECRAVRTACGLFDASTLGKIEVVGPDAAAFLERMYVNAFARLAPGRCRYGVMLREDGFVLDDGVIGRLAPDRFHVTTTTGGAARVLGVMEDFSQTEWPELDVWLTSVTEQWAVIAVQGPDARRVIAPLVEGIDMAALPHMGVAEGHVCGIAARLFRVSFTGELGFEINVPADHGQAVWEAVAGSGAAHGITPYGTEAMHVLRAEKGYIVVGQETDGTATPDDVGLGWTVGRGKPDFVGKRSLARPAMQRPDRKQLVGLLTEQPQTVLEEGAQIVLDPGQAVPMRMVGHVTSAYLSPTLGRSIALAMLAGGRARVGERVFLPMPDRTIAARVVSPVFYDPEGARLHG